LGQFTVHTHRYSRDKTYHILQPVVLGNSPREVIDRWRAEWQLIRPHTTDDEGFVLISQRAQSGQVFVGVIAAVGPLGDPHIVPNLDRAAIMHKNVGWGLAHTFNREVGGGLDAAYLGRGAVDYIWRETFEDPVAIRMLAEDYLLAKPARKRLVPVQRKAVVGPPDGDQDALAKPKAPRKPRPRKALDTELADLLNQKKEFQREIRKLERRTGDYLDYVSVPRTGFFIVRHSNGDQPPSLLSFNPKTLAYEWFRQPWKASLMREKDAKKYLKWFERELGFRHYLEVLSIEEVWKQTEYRDDYNNLLYYQDEVRETDEAITQLMIELRGQP
jgi:hypothetical protein